MVRIVFFFEFIGDMFHKSANWCYVCEKSMHTFPILQMKLNFDTITRAPSKISTKNSTELARAFYNKISTETRQTHQLGQSFVQISLFLCAKKINFKVQLEKKNRATLERDAIKKIKKVRKKSTFG